MLIFNTKAGIQAYLTTNSPAGIRTGFVPTMGALHSGHLSLLQSSLWDNDITVISIFVNPTQFNNPEDLEKYPRTLEADIEKIQTISSNILVFAPTVQEMYDGNTVSGNFTFGGLENQMEGSSRPGHFNGVGTIVKKLFEIINPDNAYFGEKDFQQLQVVKKMVQQHNMPVTVHGCPIYREPNGLAMSSRNQRLTPAEKEKSALIYKTLQEVKHKFGLEQPDTIRKYVQDVFAGHPEFTLEYFEIADEESLLPLVINENKKYRAFIAVFISNIRLIDNISLN